MSAGATTAYSFRVNEIRLSEIGPQVGKAERFDVIVLDAGARAMYTSPTPKVGHTWWRSEIQCEGCVGTARVLRVVNEPAFCGTCWPEFRNITFTRIQLIGAQRVRLSDAIIRSVLKPNHQDGAADAPTASRSTQAKRAFIRNLGD